MRMLVVTNAYAFRSLLLLFVLIIVQCVATTHPPSVSPSRLLAKQQEPSHAHQQQQQHIEQSSATDLPNRDQDVRPASSESNDSDFAPSTKAVSTVNDVIPPPVANTNNKTSSAGGKEWSSKGRAAMMRFATRTKELVEEAADSLQQQPHQGERRRAPALPARPRLLLLPPRVAALDEEQAKATLSEQLALENSPTFSPLSDDDQSMDTKNTMTSSTPTSTTPIAAPTTVTLTSPPTESVVRQLLIQTLEAAEPAAAAVNDGAKMKIQQKSTTLKDVDIKGDKKKKRRREFFTPSRSVIGEDFEFAPNSRGFACLYGAPEPLYNTPRKRCVLHSPLCGVVFTCVMDVHEVMEEVEEVEVAVDETRNKPEMREKIKE